MRLLIATLAVSTLMGGCACSEADLIGVTAQLNEPTVTVATPTTVDDRIPGGWRLYPGDDPAAMCSNFGDIDLPCRDILAVCVASADGTMEPKWLGEVYRCTSESPTWRDVCRTRPEAEWAFYGYTREECATA